VPGADLFKNLVSAIILATEQSDTAKAIILTNLADDILKAEQSDPAKAIILTNLAADILDPNTSDDDKKVLMSLADAIFSPGEKFNKETLYNLAANIHSAAGDRKKILISLAEAIYFTTDHLKKIQSLFYKTIDSDLKSTLKISLRRLNRRSQQRQPH
jgi:hypothetical protein